MPKLILFVCEVNTGRSPMAAALFTAVCAQRGLGDVVADSAGLTAREGELVPAPVQQALAEVGVPLLRLKSKRLTPKLALAAELVVTLASEHRERLVELMPRLRLKTVMLMAFAGEKDREVPDPFGGGLEAYRACLRQMRPALEALADELAAEG
jgi:protein-tyrosine phosphatase